MFKEEISVQLINNKLHINYFEGAVVVDVKDERDAYEYLQTQARRLASLRSNLLREAEKFIKQEG